MHSGKRHMLRESSLSERGSAYRFSSFALLCVMLFAVLPARAQTGYDTSRLTGTVFDPQGAVIPGATITVTNAATGLTKTSKSQADGSYQVPALPPGIYRVTAEARGFRKALAERVVLTLGQAVPFDFHLVLGALSQEMLVTSEPPLTQPGQTQQANTINERQVENLPNVSRSFAQSIYTVPGVVSSYGPTLQDPGVGTGYLASGFSIGGSNGRNNLVTIDGGENDYGSGALRVTNVPLDSVQGIQVNRNSFQAEFGYTVGSAINMVTKSGTNRFHGSAYTYFHDNATDAANYFNQFGANPSVRPFEQSVIAGGTLGGPIKKNKLFFFTSYEHQQIDWPTVVNYAGQQEFAGVSPAFPGASAGQVTYVKGLAASGIPGSAKAVADLVANLNPFNTANAARPDLARSAALLQAIVTADDGAFDGLPNAFGAERGIPGFNYPRARYNNAETRFDFLPSSTDNLFIRFYYLHEAANVVPQPPTSEFDRVNSFQVSGSWFRVIRPSVVNTLLVQAVPHDGRLSASPLPFHSEVDLGTDIFLGNPFAFPYDANQKRFQFDDDISWVKGSHTFKFGISYRPAFYSVFEQLWFGGQWHFSDGAFPIIKLANNPGDATAIATYNATLGASPVLGPPSANLTAGQSYVAGLPASLLQANPNSNSKWAAWDQNLGLYAQDSWKAAANLTLNYGVRVDSDHAASPIPSSTYASPRLGIAWDPAGNGKTVIRAGGGIFVAPVLFIVPFYVNNLGDSGKYINWAVLPFISSLPSGGPITAVWAATQAAATLANPNPAPAFGTTVQPPGPASSGSVFVTLGPNFKPEYSIQASMSIDREIAPNLSLEIGYDMYRSLHIEQSVETNFVRASCGALGAVDAYGVPVNSQGIDPFIGPCYIPKPGTTAGEPNAAILSNDAFSSVGSGIYHGLTASLTKRYHHSLQFQVNYTFSRAIDDTSDFSTLTTPYRPDLLKADRAVSDFNVTHNFVANAVYQTPFRDGGGLWSRILEDITVSPIVTARSGFPFTLFVPGLANAFPTGNGTSTESTHARPFKEGRNTGMGPDFISWDMRVSKALYLRRDRGLRLDVIVQASNLLNRTNFAAVNDNFPSDPNFKLPNGLTLLNGPYGVTGFKPTSAPQISKPLAFTQAYPARQLSFGLQLAF